MKKIIILTVATLMFSMTVKSQINLENSYSLLPNPTRVGLTVIKLDISGDKYCLYDIKAKKIKLYNLNHSLFKSINLTPLPKYRNSNLDSLVSIAYISENLFNTDNLVEVLSFDGDWFDNFPTSSYGSMNIFNELGSIIFSGDSLMPCEKRGATYFGSSDEDFIFNTSFGSKMILYSYKNNTSTQKVYSLPGKLTTNVSKLEMKSDNILPFPNPTNNSISLPYKLETGKDGKLIINDVNGKILLEYKIDSTFDNLIIDTNTMIAGNYFYSIFSAESKVSSGKFIVAK